MANRYVPADLSLMEAACVNWVLNNIKNAIMGGVPSGQAIEQAIEEVFMLRQSSSSGSSSFGESPTSTADSKA